MADNYLITGYHGTPHVTAENDRGIHGGIMGAGRFILPTGEQFRAEYIGNNTIRMYDGKLIDGGAAAGIPAGEYVDLLISNAGQNAKRNDLIVFEYKKDASTMIETGAFVVVQGTETNGTPSDPTLVQADLLSGSAAHDQMPMWRVVVNGSTISNPVQVFEVSQPVRGHTHSAEDISGGTIPIANGGTGATTAKAAEYNITGGMSESTNAITDSDQITFKRSSVSATNGVFVYKTASRLWTYILGKIRSTFGFASDNILPISNGGTGATTSRAAEYNICGDMTESTVAMNDNSQMVFKLAGSASTTNGALTYKTADLLWTYVSKKIRSTFGFSTGDVLPITNGGTGATDAATARTALGITPTNIGAAKTSHTHGADDISSGTFPIERGGTGATTDRAAEYNICGGMSESAAATSDSTLIVCKLNASASTTNGVLTYKKASDVWTWIANKIKSVFPTAAVEMQMGVVNNVNSTGVTVTFPTAFSGVPVVVASGGSEASSVQVKNVTKTGFKIESPMSNNDGCQWIAVYKA